MPVTQTPVKTALRKALLPDVFTSSLYACAPSRGCSHGCLYCDGRAEKYYFDGDFARDITVRTNLPDLLATELPRIRERDFTGRRSLVSLGSGTTDVYQGVTEVRATTRACAEVLAAHDFPVLVITKSAHIQKDLDLWSRVAQNRGFVLLMTIAQADEAVRRRFEPGASSLEARWETLAAFRQAGASVGVLAMPLLPGISDDERTLRTLYEKAATLGADYLMAGGLTLRPGRQKDLFLDALKPLSPDLMTRYQLAYHEDRLSGSPRSLDRRELNDRIRSVAAEFELPYLWPQRVHSRFLPRYESWYLLMLQMEALYSDQGEALPRLRDARDRYARWLTEKRSMFRRHRTLEDTWIDSEFEALLAPGALEALLANKKLAAFLRKTLTP